MGEMYIPSGPDAYTYEPTTILNMMKKEDREELARLRNLELQGKIEILHEESITTPQMITQDGDVYPAKLERVLEYATISREILEEVPQTDV